MSDATKIEAPPGGASDMGLKLYTALADKFTERTAFVCLAVQVACAAHDSGMADGYITAICNTARDLVNDVPGLRMEAANGQ